MHPELSAIIDEFTETDEAIEAIFGDYHQSMNSLHGLCTTIGSGSNNWQVSKDKYNIIAKAIWRMAEEIQKLRSFDEADEALGDMMEEVNNVQICENCKAWKVSRDRGEDCCYGECRIDQPPWPSTFSSDWCMKFIPRQAEKAIEERQEKYNNELPCCECINLDCTDKGGSNRPNISMTLVHYSGEDKNMRICHSYKIDG